MTLLRRENELPSDFRALYEFVRMMDPSLRYSWLDITAVEAKLEQYCLGNNEMLRWALETFAVPALAKLAKDVYLASTILPPRSSHGSSQVPGFRGAAACGFGFLHFARTFCAP